jgi:hypothetical protein
MWSIILIAFLAVASWAVHRGDYGWAVWFFGFLLMLLKEGT